MFWFLNSQTFSKNVTLLSMPKQVHVSACLCLHDHTEVVNIFAFILKISTDSILVVICFTLFLWKDYKDMVFENRSL